MDFHEIIKMQHEFDRRHGWDTRIQEPEERLRAIEKDLIGLFGETGEAANCLKKVRLRTDKGEECGNVYSAAAPELREELIDAFIYLVRLLDLTETDVEAEYLRKLRTNEKRFEAYQNGKS